VPTADILEWLKALGGPLVALAVLFWTWFFNRWQIRHALYDRRHAIYVAFQDLLLALPEKGDNEIKAALRKASMARFEAPFLLGDDPKIKAYLDQLCKQVTDDVIANIMFRDAVNDAAAMRNNPQAVADFTARVSRLGAAKLDIPDRHLRELPQQFARFLKL
jgi:hypothetical protein